jgi:hypothetical protein
MHGVNNVKFKELQCCKTSEECKLWKFSSVIFKVINYAVTFETSHKTSAGSRLIATNSAYSTKYTYKTLHGCGSAAFFQHVSQSSMYIGFLYYNSSMALFRQVMYIFFILALLLLRAHTSLLKFVSFC